METRDITDLQKQVLANIARRLRRQADELERLIRSANRKKLNEACGMLHAAETELTWVRNNRQDQEYQPDPLSARRLR